MDLMKVSFWVATCVVATAKSKARASIVEKFIAIMNVSLSEPLESG